MSRHQDDPMNDPDNRLHFHPEAEHEPRDGSPGNPVPVVKGWAYEHALGMAMNPLCGVVVVPRQMRDGSQSLMTACITHPHPHAARGITAMDLATLDRDECMEVCEYLAVRTAVGAHQLIARDNRNNK